MPTFLSQLFDLPRQVRQGDFVLKLTDGVRNPEATLRDYVVTERLAKAFDEAPLKKGSEKGSVLDIGYSPPSFLRRYKR
jgi:hypothetical protein